MSLLIKQGMFPVVQMNRFVVVVVGFTFFETNEVDFFSQQKNRVKDFREAIIKYLEAMMESQQQVCKLLLCREELVVLFLVELHAQEN